MTIYFPSHQIIIRRARNRGNNKLSFSATFTVYSADIQPISAERIQFFDSARIGKSYEAWVGSDVDIKEGDQILTGGRKYGVSAVATYEGAGLLDHKYLILYAQD